MVYRRISKHLNTLIQETAVPGTGTYITDPSARENTVLKGKLGRDRLKLSVFCFFCLFYAV